MVLVHCIFSFLSLITLWSFNIIPWIVLELCHGQENLTRGQWATGRSPEWHSHCRYADVMQLFPILSSQLMQRSYFIVSGEISVYLMKIKLVSITSELILYHFTSDWYNLYFHSSLWTALVFFIVSEVDVTATSDFWTPLTSLFLN